MQLTNAPVLHHHNIWIAYFIGAVLTLTGKYVRYCYEGNKINKSLSVCTKEWFFENTLSNGASWATTIGIVWSGGYLYINRLVFFMVPSIPVDVPIAFLIGSLMESFAPDIVKWIARQMPFGKN